MRRYKYFLLFLPFLICSSSLWVPHYKPVTEQYAVLSIYEIAEEVTGAPANILRAIAIVESNEKDTAIGDDGISKGRMQINELYRKERIQKYGYYDPFNPLDSVILSGYIYMANLRIFKNVDKAIASHRQGRTGVIKNGATMWYVNRVKRYLDI